jgi:hypothetical protein
MYELTCTYDYFKISIVNLNFKCFPLLTCDESGLYMSQMEGEDCITRNLMMCTHHQI